MNTNSDRLRERHLMIIKEALRAKTFTQSDFTRQAAEFISSGLKIAKQGDHIIHSLVDKKKSR